MTAKERLSVILALKAFKMMVDKISFDDLEKLQSELYEDTIKELQAKKQSN